MKNVAKEIDTQFDSGRRDMDVDEIFKNAGVSNKFNSAYRDNIKGYIKELNEMSKSAPRAKTGIDGVNEALEKQGSAPVKSATNVLESINSGMASIGKTALSIGGNVVLDLALSYGLQKAGEAWDNYSHQQENAIQKGNEALDRYKQTNQEMQAATSWVKDNGERFVELSNKATKLGEQGSLTDAEFKEYNQLSTQASQYFSDQITGYNSLGTAITSVAQSKNSLDTALTTEKLQKYSQAADEAKDVVGKFKAEMYQDKGITKETGITNQMDAIDSFLKDYDSGKVKEAFEGASILDPGLSSAYTQNLNLLDSMRQAGIKSTGFLGHDFSFDDFLNEDNIQSLRNYYQDLKTQAADSLSAIKQVMPSFLQEQEAYQKLIDKNPNIDSAMATMLTGMDQSGIERILGGNVTDLSDEEIVKNFRDWSSKLVTNLQDPETQEAFENLFSIDDNKASLSFKDYEKKATDAVDAVSKKTSAFTKDELKQQSGITDSLDEMQTAYNNIADRFGKDKGFSEDYVKNKLSANDMLTLSSMATDNQYKDLSYNDALERIQNVQDKAKLSLDSMQKVVTTATANLSTLQSATSEASSATGLTADTITSMGGIFSDIDNFDSAALFKNTANGVKLNTKALSNLLAVQHDIKANDFTRSIEEQTKAIAEQNEVVQAQTKGTDAYKTEQDKLKSMFADLSALQQAQSQYHALYKQQQELFSDYGQWEQAQSTANAGDKYNNMVSGLQAAKGDWDKGLIGTDDFKSFAKLISPSGATDDVNFAENYAKAARYLTEDESGVKAFLNDLSSKGLADFNEESQQWSYNVKDMAEAAKQMGMGKDFMSNMFGRLEDYGFHNNVISDAEDGVLKLSDAYSNLAESEARLEDLKKNDPTNTTAIEQAEKEVSGYKQDIDELGTNLKEVASHTAENYNRELETAKNQMKTLADERERILKSNEYGENTQAVADYMQSQIDQLGQSYGLDSSVLQQQAEQAAKAYSDALQNATIENPVTPDFGEDTASANAYASAVDKVQQANKDNNQTLSDSIKTLQQYNSEQVKGINLFDGAYDSDELKPAEQALDNICQSLGLTSEEAGLLGQVLESMGIIKPEVDDSEVKQAKTDAEETKQTYDNLGDSTVSINADVSGEDSVASFVDQCSSIQQGMTTTITATVSGESEVESLESGLEQIPDNTPTTVDVTVNNQQDLDTIQSKVDSLNAGGKDITLNAHIKPDTNSEVEVKAKDTTVKVTPDPKEVEVTAKPVKAQVEANPKEVNVHAKLESAEVDGYNPPSDKEAIITFKKDSSVPDGYQPEDKYAWVHYQLDSSAVDGYQPPDKSATVTYHVSTVHDSSSGGTHGGKGGGFATGTMLSIAHANGTMHNFPWNYQRISPAFAKGDVAITKPQDALVNEEYINGHSESIVRDGVWSTIPGGAHFEHLKKGDIIFSAQQTEDLLKHGATTGHARAYAGGSGWGGFGGGLSNKTSVSSNSSKSTSNNTKATNENTKATKSNTKSAKDSTETFDWVKVHLEKFSKAVERISNQITDYISSAFKISLLKKQMKAIDKQIVAEQQGYDAYMNKANSIGISDDYKNKVINGTLSIEDIDTSTDEGKKLAKDVKNFQTYYNSAMDCKDSVQELNNKLLELYETLANMPTEKAEKAIDKLKSKYDSFSNISDAISGGGSAISILARTIKTDNPKLAKALTNQRKAQTERNKTKKIRSDASKNLKAEKNDIKKSGSKLVQASAKNVATSGRTLKKVAKGNTDNATYNAIAQAVRNGTAVDLKGLKGNVLKEAKAYNKSLTIDKKVNTAVKNNKKVSTSGMPKSLKNVANPYNKDAKNLDVASKAYDTARKNDDKALKNLTKVTDVKESEYRKTSKAQQIVALNKDRNSYVIQNKLLDYQADNLKQQMEQRQKATNEASKNYEKDRKKLDAAKKKQDSLQKSLLKDKSFTSSLSKDQLSRLKSGKSFSLNGLTGDNLKKGQQWLNQLKQTSTLTTKAKITQNALTKAVEESTAAEAEYAKTLVENAQKKLDNISDYYDSKMALNENKNSLLDNYMDRMQTRGYDLSSTFYTAQIANYKKIANDQKAQLAAMKEAFQDALDDGSIIEGTQDFWDMQNAIDKVTISITETTNSIVDLQAKMRDLEWEQFDKGQEAVGRIASESDFLIKLLSHKDLYQKDTGKLTDEGLATMGLHGVNYNTYMAQADKYKEEMLKISKELANDPYNQKLIDRKNELVDAQQDAILSAEDEKDAMKDLVKDGIDKELDALKDLIEKYEDKLQAEKDLYDYEKKIRDKSEKVASLQKQLAALQGDNSEENKAKLQELRKNLKDAQEDLEDKQYDKYISDQKDLLDDFYDKYEEILNQRLDNIDTLIQDCINQVNSGSGKISDTINSASQNVNYSLSADMKEIWSSTDNVGDIISAYEKGTFTNQTTAVKTAVDNVWNRQQDMINAINEMAAKYVQKSENDTQQPSKTQAVIKEEKYNPPKPETSKDKNNAVGTVGQETLSKKDDKGKTEGTLSDDNTPSSNKNKKTGNGKAEVGDKVTFASGVYHGASDGSGRTGNYYLGKQVKIAHINKGAPYPYSIVSADGKTQLGWVKLNQLKGYASGIMKVPNDQLAWTQEQGEEAIVRNDGSILTPLSKDVSVINADMTKNLWDFMGNPGGFLNDYSNGEKFGVKNESSNIVNQFDNLTFNLPNVQNSDDFIKEMANSKTFEKMVCAMTVDRLNGGSSLKKYKYRS